MKPKYRSSPKDTRTIDKFAAITARFRQYRYCGRTRRYNEGCTDNRHWLRKVQRVANQWNKEHATKWILKGSKYLNGDLGLYFKGAESSKLCGNKGARENNLQNIDWFSTRCTFNSYNWCGIRWVGKKSTLIKKSVSCYAEKTKTLAGRNRDRLQK
jgi:hypothetical protein